MADKAERVEDGNIKIRIFGNKMSFSDEIKKHFSLFLKGCHLMKNKNLIKNSGYKL